MGRAICKSGEILHRLSSLTTFQPELYSLAIAAVREGSEAAMDMLVCLPDMNSTFNGGWLFDYVFEPALEDSPIKAKRWRFRSAHKIDQPCTVEEKRQRLELALRPENVRYTDGRVGLIL